MRQHPPAVAVRLAIRPRRHVDRLEAVGHRVVDRFLRRQRAHAVHQPAARSHQWRGRDDDSPLQTGQVVDVGRRDPPAGVGAASQRAEPAAGRVDQDLVEASTPRTVAQPRRRPRPAPPGSRRGTVHLQIGGDHVGTRRRHRRRLAAGRGAHVEDPLARLRLRRLRPPTATRGPAGSRRRAPSPAPARSSVTSAGSASAPSSAANPLDDPVRVAQPHGVVRPDHRRVTDTPKDRVDEASRCVSVPARPSRRPQHVQRRRRSGVGRRRAAAACAATAAAPWSRSDRSGHRTLDACASCRTTSSVTKPRSRSLSFDRPSSLCSSRLA